MHFGHIMFLQSAKKLGNFLVVALESDENVARSKGPNRPIHSQRQRRLMLEALSCVDEVIELSPMDTDEQYYTLTKQVHPDIIAVTQGDPKFSKKELQATSIGAKIIEIPKIITPSTSQLARLLELE